MLQPRLEESAYQSEFQRASLASGGLRLDGRRVSDWRDVVVFLNRSEKSSRSEVSLGDTRCVCSVRGDIVAPYPDRPSEGILQFNAAMSPAAEAVGYTSHEVTRLLERSIRESDAIDTESLCIVSGERVWLITCDVCVLDCDGNVTDGCMLAALAALRAFRRPEVSIALAPEVTTAGSGSGGGSGAVKVTLHSSDEREPLPLALHHTPLAVTFGVLAANDSTAASPGGFSGGAGASTCKLVADCTASEEAALNGSLVCCVNGHEELCAVHLPGRVGIPPPLLLQGSRQALQRAQVLHAVVDSSLAELEKRVELVKKRRLLALQKLEGQRLNAAEAGGASAAAVDTAAAAAGGIDKSDPMLSWQLLHRPAVLRDE